MKCDLCEREGCKTIRVIRRRGYCEECFDKILSPTDRLDMSVHLEQQDTGGDSRVILHNVQGDLFS